MNKSKIQIDLDSLINNNEKGAVQEEFNCPICCCLIFNAVQCSKCKANFCKNCLDDWQQKKDSQLCPVSNCSDFQLEKPHPFFYKALSSLKIKCIHPQCQSNTSYEQYEKHLENCDWKPIQCPNYASGCQNQDLILKDLQLHLKECLYEEINCLYCEKQCLKKDIENHEINQCDQIPVKCCYQQCQEMVKKCFINDHLKVCEYREEECDYCKINFLLKDVDFHQKNCDQKLHQCQYCKKEFLLKELQKHEENVCEKYLTICQICDSNLSYKESQNHDQQQCLLQSFLNLKKNQQLLQQENKDLQEQHQQIKKQLQEVERLQQQRQRALKDAQTLSIEIIKLEESIKDIMIKNEYYSHQEKKHKVNLDEFDDLWRHWKWINGTFTLYEGFHAFHCIPCMKLVKNLRPIIQPYDLKRKLMKMQVQELLYSCGIE